MTKLEIETKTIWVNLRPNHRNTIFVWKFSNNFRLITEIELANVQPASTAVTARRLDGEMGDHGTARKDERLHARTNGSMDLSPTAGSPRMARHDPQQTALPMEGGRRGLVDATTGVRRTGGGGGARRRSGRRSLARARTVALCSMPFSGSSG